MQNETDVAAKPGLRFRIGRGIGYVIRETAERIWSIVLPYLAFLFIGGLLCKVIVYFIPALQEWFGIMIGVCALIVINIYFFLDDHFDAWRERVRANRNHNAQYQRRHARREN